MIRWLAELLVCMDEWLDTLLWGPPEVADRRIFPERYTPPYKPYQTPPPKPIQLSGPTPAGPPPERRGYNPDGWKSFKQVREGLSALPECESEEAEALRQDIIEALSRLDEKKEVDVNIPETEDVSLEAQR